MPRVRSVIFDMDGTLFDSRTAIIPAVRDALETVARERGYSGPLASDQEIARHIGEASRKFYVDLTPVGLREHVDRIAELVRAGERRRIEAGQTRLFDGVRDTLSALREGGTRIAFYSNSGPGYFYTVLRAHGILDLSDTATCHGEKKATKVRMVAELKQRLGQGDLAVVGDRHHDIEAAKANDAVAVAALYGFGGREELTAADIFLERFPDLPALLR